MFQTDKNPRKIGGWDDFPLLGLNKAALNGLFVGLLCYKGCPIFLYQKCPPPIFYMGSTS